MATVAKYPYRAWRQEIQKRYDDFLHEKAFFAFNQEQFNEGMERLKPTPENKLVACGAGMYILKSDLPAFLKLGNETAEAQDARMKDPAFVYDMFRHELGNHEYCITGEYDETLDACGISYEDLEEHPMWAEQLYRAKDDYMKDVEAFYERNGGGGW